MKFGKSIGSQQETHGDLHYIDYKFLKKKIKDTVAKLQAQELDGALKANSMFEEDLSGEIAQVNECFSKRQRSLLEQVGDLSELLQEHQRQEQEAFGCAEGACSTADMLSDAFRRLVDILGEVDQLRKYAVWNAVGVVKILKKRRKQTNLGPADVATERAGWLSRQSFFSGSDFAELHAAIESLGHMLVMLELNSGARGVSPGGSQRLAAPVERERQQCPICLDTISDMVELSCQHRFCWKCFVLGPIAFQPGEYRITQCPICRRETDGPGSSTAGQLELGPDGDGAGTLEGLGGMLPSSEGVLTRFLHTYFPQDALKGVMMGEEDEEGQGEENEKEMRDVVGELVKALMGDSNWQRQVGAHGAAAAAQGQSAAEAMESGSQSASAAATSHLGAHASSGSSQAIPSDFFHTLPPRQMQEKQQIGTAQKLQWLHFASTGDPFAVDSGLYCSLCSEPLLMEAVVTTPCKHHFHRICIRRIDMPNCPLCSCQLPFSWFLPSDHPCAETGFRVVQARAYKPLFAGGPSRGSAGYPLRRPPPVSLHCPDGNLMKSYLHRVLPTGDTEEEEEAPSPQLSPSAHSRTSRDAAEGAGSSESSSEDSQSNDGSDDGRLSLGPQLCVEHRAARVGHSDLWKGKTRAWAYSALGRMRLCERAPGVPTIQRQRGDSASACGASSEQRNPTVLLIGNHI